MPEAVADYSRFIAVSPVKLKAGLLATTDDHFHWRRDAPGRIRGGRKRTFLPNPNNALDAALFGGSKEFKNWIVPCMWGAEVLMKKRGALNWGVNRVVLNLMPPAKPDEVTLPEHTDPSVFRDGVVVIGLGEAAVKLGDELVETTDRSLMVIPPSLPHSVQNIGDTRISIALMCDTRLEAGEGVVTERLRAHAPQLIPSLHMPHWHIPGQSQAFGNSHS